MAEVRELLPQFLENHENEQKSEISQYCKPPKSRNCDTFARDNDFYWRN